MVEVLTIVVLVILVRAAYLRIVRGKEAAKEFVANSTKEVHSAMGWGLGVLIGLVLFIMLIIAVAF